jgi:pimeloyl-ACP methyl ester carboxylesterase/DNA-binding CsgD family transcriptional regulator
MTVRGADAAGDAGELSIRYARSVDGVRIAYAVHGDGPALVQTPSFPVSHLEIEWRGRSYRTYWEKLAFDRKLVRYDCRGAGLSDRDAWDFSLEKTVADLEAVVDKAGLERFALFGFGHSGPTAISYAAKHPERVSHLLLWYTYARAADYVQAPRVEAGRSLIEKDWELYTELEGHRAMRGRSAQSAGGYTRFLRESATPGGLTAAFAAIRDNDITPLLPKVKAPTLVLHRKESRILSVDVARELASTIPDARLVLLEGSSIAPFLGDVDTTVAQIRSFLEERSGSEALPGGISRREADVLVLIARGKSNSDIADELGISERTVARHITNLYRKIGAHNKADATAFAYKHQLA